MPNERKQMVHPMKPGPLPDPVWRLADLAQIPPVDCSCGTTRRAFVHNEDAPASVHRVEIGLDSTAHYHKRLTEIYYILECGPGAALELDGQQVLVQPGQCCMIPPGIRHRAVGTMTVLNIVVPRFDPEDEWFD